MPRTPSAQVAHLRSERDVLRLVEHPLVVQLVGVCQDEHCVYFITEYVPGGEFFSHLKSQGRLGEEAARFYAAEVLLVFEYLHSLDIVYRDLKVRRPGWWAEEGRSGVLTRGLGSSR